MCEQTAGKTCKDKTHPRRIDAGVSQLSSGCRDCSRDGGSSHSHPGRADVCDDKNVVLIQPTLRIQEAELNVEHVSAAADSLASTPRIESQNSAHLLGNSSHAVIGLCLAQVERTQNALLLFLPLIFRSLPMNSLCCYRVSNGYQHPRT